MGKGPRIKTCPECGAPRRITKENIWLKNGKIVERRNPSHRMIFIENDNVVGVFESIEKILGLSIEHIVIESERKLSYDYVYHLIPEIVKRIMRATSIKPVAKSITLQGRLMGYGDVELLEQRLKGDEGDRVKLGVRDVSFPAFFSGIVAGAMEALIGQECGVSYQETSPGYLEVTATVSNVPVELKERLQPLGYSDKGGDVKLERCSVCGGPKALSGFEWRAGTGSILDRTSGRRMILAGPAEFETIFAELEKELGEDVPRVIIEAQRHYAGSGFYTAQDARDAEGLRKALALRGLGNLRDLSWKGDRLRLRIENPCLHLLLVGLAQGLYELSSDRESAVEWRLADDGDLTVEACARC